MNDVEVNAVTSDSGVVPIRHFDASGRLVAAGTAWSELRKVPVWLTAIAFLIVWFPTGFAFIAALASGFALKPVLAFMAGVVALFGVCRVGLRFCGRQRSVVFHEDGWIETPEGLPWIGGRKFHELSFAHDTVSTIEQRFAERFGGKIPMYFIEVRTHEGDWVTVGHLVDEQISHKAVVQLTKALADIREAIARPEDRFTAQDALNATRAATAGVKAGETVHVVID